MATQTGGGLPVLGTGSTDSPTASQGTAPTANTGTATATTGTATDSTATNGQTTGSTGSTAGGSQPTLGGSSSGSSSSSTSVAGITGAPSLSTATTGGGGGGLTITGSGPKLSGYYSYPPASVPPTAGAPYLTSSSLPQNFVFIVVGSILAFFALCILVWRFVAAWSVNRSVKRDALAAYTPLPDMKKTLHKNESAHDMSDLSARLPKSFGSVPNLFFSPTAQAARHSHAGRPASQHMPSGHYRDASR